MKVHKILKKFSNQRIAQLTGISISTLKKLRSGSLPNHIVNLGSENYQPSRTVVENTLIETFSSKV